MNPAPGGGFGGGFSFGAVPSFGASPGKRHSQNVQIN